MRRTVITDLKKKSHRWVRSPGSNSELRGASRGTGKVRWGRVTTHGTLSFYTLDILSYVCIP